MHLTSRTIRSAQKKIGSLASALLSLLFVTQSCYAQANKAHTLDDLINIAINSNSEILAARDQAKAVSGQLSAARAIPNPEFEGVRGQQKLRTDNSRIGSTSSWSVTQPLDMPYTRIPRVNAAEAQLQAADAMRMAKEFEIISKVKNRYYDYMRRQEE